MVMLIVFEGLDQSGKQTQAEMLRDRLKKDGRKARLVSFPDYGTSIGEEIARALQGEREYGPDVMQLLYIANRYERKPDLQRWLDGGLVLVSDRYLASSIAYGEAFGLDPLWLKEIQKYLPPPALTITLPPVVSPCAPMVVVATAAGSRRKARFLVPPTTVLFMPMVMSPVNAPGAPEPAPKPTKFVVEIVAMSAFVTVTSPAASMPIDLLDVRGRRKVAPPFELIDAPTFARLNASAARTMLEVLAGPPLLIAAWLVMLSPVRLITPLLITGPWPLT